MPQNKKESSSHSVLKKTFLILGFFCLTTFFVSIAYSTTRAPATSVTPPDYQKVLKLALDNYEEAENALIYKDIGKGKRFLDKSEKYAKMALPSPDLGKEAESLLAKIATKREEAEKAEKALEKK